MSTREVVVLGQEALTLEIRRILSQYPLCRTEGRTRLERGLSYLEEFGASAVLVDGTSHRFDPIQACLGVRKLKNLRDVPLLMVVEPNATGVKRLAECVGCTDFLNLPLEGIEVRLRISNYCDAHAATTRLRTQVASLLLELRDHLAAVNRLGTDLDSATNGLRRSHENTIQRLAQAAELRDDSTGRHIWRVSEYCGLLADRIDLPQLHQDLIRKASPLHDVGKIGIPDQILFKPGRLTRDEYDLIKRHPEYGHDMLVNADSPLLDTAAMIALTHHEKYDGSGYPNRLAGDRIPVEGRITAIADVFDALTSERCYKRAFGFDESLRIMQHGRGTHFDPELLDLFVGALPQVRQIHQQAILN